MSQNILRNHLNLTCNKDDKFFVNDAQVVRADLMATNGVLHIIDQVLIPDDGQYITPLLFIFLLLHFVAFFLNILDEYHEKHRLLCGGII